MGIRGLIGFLFKKHGWKQVDLVAEAKRQIQNAGRDGNPNSTGISVLVDAVAFSYFCIENLMPQLDPLRQFSESNISGVYKRVIDFVRSLQAAGIHLEFVVDSARGADDEEWETKFPVWKSRFEEKLRKFHLLEAQAHRIRLSGEANGRDFDQIPSKYKPNISLVIAQALTDDLKLPMTNADCEADRVIQALMKLRNSSTVSPWKSTQDAAFLKSAAAGQQPTAEVAAAAAGRLFGVIGNDSDFVVMKDSRLMFNNHVTAERGLALWSHPFSPERPLTSLNFLTANLQDLRNVLNARIRPEEFAEVAIMAGCDYTSDFDRELAKAIGNRRNFEEAVRFVSQLPPSGSGLRHVESNPHVSNLMRQNSAFAAGVSHARQFYCLGSDDSPADAADDWRRSVITHCLKVVRSRQGLPSEIPSPPPASLTDHALNLKNLSLVPDNCGAIHFTGRIWDFAVPESQAGPFIQNMLRHFHMMRYLIFSPLRDSVLRVRRTTQFNSELHTLKIPHSTTFPKCDGLSPGDHPAAHASGRYWPSILTLHKAPPATRLATFTAVFEAFITSQSRSQGECDDEEMVTIANLLHNVVSSKLPSSSSLNVISDSGEGGLIPVLIRVVEALNGHMAEQPEGSGARIKPWERESIVLALALSFWRSVEIRKRQGHSGSSAPAVGQTPDPPALAFLPRDEAWVASLDFLRNAPHPKPRDDPLALWHLDKQPACHEHLMVDVRCITLINWIENCVQILLQAMAYCGVDMCTLDSTARLHSFKGPSWKRISETYSLHLLFNAKILSWLLCAGAMTGEPGTWQSGVHHVEGGPLWISDEGARILNTVGLQRAWILQNWKQSPEFPL